MATPCSNAVAPTSQKIALVVASSRAVDEVLTSVLATEGWSIQRALDNQHALTRATTEPFDLIVTGRKNSGSRAIPYYGKENGLPATVLPKNVK
jgi:hypothetical protein